MLKNVCRFLKLKHLNIINIRKATTSKTKLKVTVDSTKKVPLLIDVTKYEPKDTEKILGVINVSTKIEDLLKYCSLFLCIICF